MDINQKLIRLYTENEKKIKVISDHFEGNLDGPHLMHCWVEEFNNASIKILFIGQEPNKWVGEAQNGLDASIDRYREFSMARESKDNTTFWQAIKQFNKIFNPSCGDNCFLWSNVCKYSDYDGKQISIEEHKYIIGELNILEEEIKIVEPDIIIFFSGPDYDERIQIQFDNKVCFESVVNEIPIRELAKLHHHSFPAHTYRTYHPNFLQRGRRWNFLNIIEADIKSYDITSIMKSFNHQLKDIGNKIGLDLNNSFCNTGEKFTGFYYFKPDWKYCGIGFEFESNGFGDFFFGICRKDLAEEIPNSIIKELEQRLSDKDGQTEYWPYWKWFDHKNWNTETFKEIENGLLKGKIQLRIEELLRKIDDLEL
jgi:hypothetical protein